jgi:dTDP-4-dehydrorhamnose 3,5-epimerase
VRFVSTRISGVTIVELEPMRDERGWFARSYSVEAFEQHGLSLVAQANVSFNPRSGTVRGLHWQAEPHAETKLVRCTRGALFDVAVDVRPDSPTRGEWLGVELSEDSPRMLLLGEGIAHGFETLADATEISYLMSIPYVPAAARGARWDDPAFGIRWPAPVRSISARDLAHPPFGV